MLITFVIARIYWNPNLSFSFLFFSFLFHNFFECHKQFSQLCFGKVWNERRWFEAGILSLYVSPIKMKKQYVNWSAVIRYTEGSGLLFLHILQQNAIRYKEVSSALSLHILLQNNPLNLVSIFYLFYYSNQSKSVYLRLILYCFNVDIFIKSVSGYVLCVSYTHIFLCYDAVVQQISHFDTVTTPLWHLVVESPGGCMPVLYSHFFT